MPMTDVERRLSELVLYLARQSEYDPYFGKKKLAKLLAFIDFAAFRRNGEPATGAQYIKLPHGPVPREFDRTLNLLRAQGTIDLASMPIGGYEQIRPVIKSGPVPDPKPSVKALADEMLARCKDDTGADVEVLSHQMPGWAIVGMKHAIPLHTAFITLVGPTERDYQDSEALADRFGWN